MTKKKLTPHSRIEDIPKLSKPSKDGLYRAGYLLLGQLHEIEFSGLTQYLSPPTPAGPKVIAPISSTAPVAANAHKARRVSAAVLLKRRQKALTKEQKILFEATVSAGIAIRLRPDALISTIPTLSAKAITKLTGAGYKKLRNFSNRYFPEFYDLIGFTAGKQLLLALVLAGVSVKFDKPKWKPKNWKTFVEDAVARELLTWEDVAIMVCGELNTPQVGTAVAKSLKENNESQVMQKVMRWLYEQDGRCAVSKKRVFLEADHKIPKEQFIKEGRDVREANTLDNYQLLTKRENVIKRGSHKLGGLSFAPTGALLTYLLLRFRPTTYDEFARMGRQHGLTMAPIRFQEGWAFAAWLAKAGEYQIEGEVAPFIKDLKDDTIGQEEDDLA